ncbi:MAG: hypothetical protein KC620_11430 [Myxococcales bacterium]|nr:hypothetical protein [Myxococcales bacterium]
MRRLLLLPSFVLFFVHPAAAEPLQGKGVHFLASGLRCPLAGVGTRPDDHCIRVQLKDDATRVRVDEATRRLIIEPGPGGDALLADLLMVGLGQDAAGWTAPVAVHLKVQRDGLSTDVHAHRTTREALPRIDLPALTVVAETGGKTQTLLTPEAARKAITDPGLTAQVAESALRFEDHLQGVQQDPKAPGFRLADVSVGFGNGLTGKLVLRARIVSLDAANAPLIAGGNLVDMLTRGHWALQMTRLSRLLPSDVIPRDLELLGIADVPLLQPVMKDGLAKGQTLRFILHAGEGRVGLDAAEAPLPDGLDVARKWLEFHFLGSILLDRARHTLAGLAERAKPATP